MCIITGHIWYGEDQAYRNYGSCTLDTNLLLTLTISVNRFTTLPCFLQLNNILNLIQYTLFPTVQYKLSRVRLGYVRLGLLI